MKNVKGPSENIKIMNPVKRPFPGQTVQRNGFAQQEGRFSSDEEKDDTPSSTI